MNQQQRITNNEKQTNDNDVVVSVKNVSKKFCKTLKRSMAYGIADLSKNLMGIRSNSKGLRKDEFWAVKDVSFELKRGEVLGLIGVNGSGKTTLLRLLSGIFPPDKGEISIKGRVGALIAVGAGFHPHMTGRENIYLNGTILGMNREEINAKFQDIVDFSEIGEFLDAPVSTYSSGMRVRLGFSIAAHIEPDVLLIDEVLAVGDFIFKQKCSEKINEICKESSILLVSHNMRDIMMLCSKTIVLSGGKVVFQGTSEDAVGYYINIVDADNYKKSEVNFSAIQNQNIYINNSIYGEVFHNEEKITCINCRWVDHKGNNLDLIDNGASISLEFYFKLHRPVQNIIIGVPIWDSSNNMISGISTDMDTYKINVKENGIAKGKLTINYLSFNPGTYTSFIAIHDGKEFLYRNYIGKFTVKNMPFYFGLITPQHSWQFEDV